MRLRFALALVSSFLFTALVDGGEVTVAYYNIKFLNAAKLPDQGNRKERLQEVIAAIHADLFGLCEIKDRNAAAAIFPPAEWGIFIDDDSTGEEQDNAIVFRKSTVEMVGGPTDLDADDEHFLFPQASDNSPFPDRRDVLFATFREKASGKTFVVVVVHLKSRLGGRHTTQFRRVDAARKIATAIETRFDGKSVVIGGDWNDNPDDISLNILETGDPNAGFGPPKTTDPVFLINLMEPLVDAGHVSHGKKASDIQANGKINTIDPDSRKRNKDGFGLDINTKAILFDQILVSDELKAVHVAGSTKVFDGGVALLDGENAASDHLPVLATFKFPDTGGTPTAMGIRIVGLLPNPAGEDAGREEVHLKNTGPTPIDLHGWRLVDRGENTLQLAGTIQPGVTRKITLAAGQLPLNNTGDMVKLFDPDGNVVHTVTYTKQDAGEGIVVPFN